MSSIASGFDDRKGWSIKMQKKFAIPIYKQYWCVNSSSICAVDEYAEVEKAAQEIDASGIDKVIQPDTGVKHIAQRFRTLSRIDEETIIDPDFSIRVTTYSGVETEYDKLLNTFRNDGNIPKIYTFGVGASVSKNECLDIGFKEFYFLKLPRFLKLFDSNKLSACASYPNGDGSKALYFDVEDLRANHIIQDAISGSVLSSVWEERDVSDDFPTAPGIKNTGQLNLFDFDGETHE